MMMASEAGPSAVSVRVAMTLTVTGVPSQVCKTRSNGGRSVPSLAPALAMRVRVAACSLVGTWRPTRSMPTSASTVS